MASVAEIERQIAASDAAIAADQARLKDRVSLEAYRSLVRTVKGRRVWTAAIQKAVDEHEIVVIPASSEPYWIDGSIVVPSDRRIEAKGAHLSLVPGTDVVMLRNRNVVDGTLKPIPPGNRDRNIAIVGGRWSDWRRASTGFKSGRYDAGERAKGNFLGLAALLYFGNCDRVTLRDATIVHSSSFAVQTGDGDGRLFERIRLEDCHGDGIHLNGNLTRVHVRDVRGNTGDDMVSLNARDIEVASVNFGPQRWILCEDIEQVARNGRCYPAVRILPMTYRYADGTVIDCSVNDVIFRRIRGIAKFKMHYHMPRYRIGERPDWIEHCRPGSGGNLHFEDIVIDLNTPIGRSPTYMRPDPVRGHFASFELGANYRSVFLKNIDITFHGDRFPLSHLVSVGPKSCPQKSGRATDECFDPYPSCTVDLLTLENIRCRGVKIPKELVHTTVFSDVNRDGLSSGRGEIRKIVGLEKVVVDGAAAPGAEARKDWAPGEWPVIRRFDAHHLEQISMPMGGIGTGCVALGGRGELRDWQIGDRPDRGAPHHGICDPFFALWAKPRGGRPFVRMLAGPLEDSEYFAGTGRGSGSRAPNFGMPRFREASFEAAYPFGVANLSSRDLPVRARVKGFSPFVPGDAEASGLPLAVVTYEIENLTDEPMEVSVCGTMRNLSGKDNVAKEGAGCKGVFFTGPKSSHALATATDGRVTTRTGFGKSYWNREIYTWWSDFSSDGELSSDGATDAKKPMASLASKRTVAAHGKAAFTFYITWHFPVKTGWSTRRGRERNWYAAPYRNAWDEVEKIVPRVPALEERTRAFVTALANSSLPAEVKDAALSTAAVLKSPTVFRIASGHLMGYEGTGDSNGTCYGNCTHVWNYEYATAYLFGELARSMREVEFVHGMEENGLAWCRVNLPLGKAPRGNPEDFGTIATDGQMGSIMRTYRDWQFSGDETFLKRMYPRVKKALAFAWLKIPESGWDADRDGLMEGSQRNTMDCGYHGPNPLCEFWYLGALRAVEEMAKAVGDAAFATECRRLFESGSKLTDKMLFNGEYYEQIVYRPGTKTVVDISDPAAGAPDFQVGTGCEADMLAGQNMALMLGLGWLADPAHIRKTLESIAKYNYRTDFTDHFTINRGFAMGEERGLLNAVHPHGKSPAVPLPYFSEVWTGVEYTAGTGLLLVGREEEARRTYRDVRDRHEGARRNPFSEPECGHYYARSMAAWSAVPAWCGFRYSGPAKAMSFAAKDGTWFWSNGSAFGTATVKGTDVNLHVIEGRLPKGLRVFVRREER